MIQPDPTVAEKLQTGQMSHEEGLHAGRFIKGFTTFEFLKQGNALEEIKRYLKGELTYKQLSPETRTITGRASTINLDLDGEIILPEAIAARLDRFTAGHRPFLGNHAYGTDDAGPTQIGWVQKTIVEMIEVICAFLFGLTDAAEKWWLLAIDQKGFGIAFSIGFVPVRYVRGSVADLVQQFPQIRPAIAAAGLAGDATIRVWTEVELLEISAVGVPCNRQSTQILAAAFGGKSPAWLEKHLTDLAAGIKQISDRQTAIEELLTGLNDLVLTNNLGPDHVNPLPERPRSRSANDGQGGGPGQSAAKNPPEANPFAEAIGALRTALKGP